LILEGADNRVTGLVLAVHLWNFSSNLAIITFCVTNFNSISGFLCHVTLMDKLKPEPSKLTATFTEASTKTVTWTRNVTYLLIKWPCHAKQFLHLAETLYLNPILWGKIRDKWNGKKYVKSCWLQLQGALLTFWF